MKFILLYLITFLPIESLSYRDKDTLINQNIKATLNIEIGQLIGNKANEFFDIYNNIMKENANYFGNSKYENWATSKISLKIKYKEKFRLGIETAYYNSFFKDAYKDSAVRFSTLFERSHFQNINLTTIPVLFSFDYIPFYKSQFRTYYGIAIGLAMTNIRWEERVYSDVDLDIRQPGIQINDRIFSPSYRIYTGLELGFDKEEVRSFFGGLIFEIGISQVFRYYQFFKELNSQLYEPNSKLEKDIEFIPFYLSINLGISFNFYY